MSNNQVEEYEHFLAEVVVEWLRNKMVEDGFDYPSHISANDFHDILRGVVDSLRSVLKEQD